MILFCFCFVEYFMLLPINVCSLFTRLVHQINIYCWEGWLASINPWFKMTTAIYSIIVNNALDSIEFEFNVFFPSFFILAENDPIFLCMQQEHVNWISEYKRNLLISYHFEWVTEMRLKEIIIPFECAIFQLSTVKYRRHNYFVNHLFEFQWNPKIFCVAHNYMFSLIQILLISSHYIWILALADSFLHPKITRFRWNKTRIVCDYSQKSYELWVLSTTKELIWDTFISSILYHLIRFKSRENHRLVVPSYAMRLDNRHTTTNNEKKGRDFWERLFMTYTRTPCECEREICMHPPR